MHLLRKRRYEDLGRSHWLREDPYTGQLRQSDEHSPGKERGLFCDAFPREMNRLCVEGRRPARFFDHESMFPQTQNPRHKDGGIAS